MNQITIKNSIGMRLLKYVFLFYCFATILLTASHMIVEYSRTNDEIKASLKRYQSLFEQTVSNAVWHFDLKQLNVTLDGILNLPEIIGVSIHDAQDQYIMRKGVISTQEKHKKRVKLIKEHQDTPTFEPDMFWHQFDLISDSSYGTPEKLGTVIFYSNSKIAISKVAGVFKSIILFALVKTFILWGLFLFFAQRFLSKPLNNLVYKMILFTEKQTGKPMVELAPGNHEIELIENTFEKISDKLDNTMTDLTKGYTKLSTIAAILEISSSSKSVNSLLESILKELIKNSWLNSKGCAIQGGCITLFQTDKNSSVRAYAGLPKEAIQQCVQMEKDGELCLCKQSVEPGEVLFSTTLNPKDVCTDDCSDDSGYYCVPIIGNKNKDTIGIMTCFVEGGIQNGEEDKPFLASIAHAISNLIERKLAEDDVERHQDFLEKMVQERTKQLIHSERLATLGTFSAGMAHEINNPNSFIRGNVQYLQNFWQIAKPILDKNAQEDSSGRVHRFSGEISGTLKDILMGSERISTIVDSLKRYSKGGFETDKVVCRLADPVKDSLHLLERIIRDNHILVNTSIPPELTVHCDRQQMSQVFVNLVNNAIDALEGSRVQQKKITIQAEPIEKHVWIRVVDNGPGIPEDAIGKIFDPFFTTKGKTKGTGLGLSIVQGIIEDHRGQITIYSAPDSDTEILIILPISTP